MKDLGRLLKELRGNRSLREVAEVTELSHTYISDIEKGYRRGTKKPIHPSPDILKRLAEAYGYPYEELMRVAGYLEDEEEYQEFASNPELNHFFRDIAASEEEEQRELRQIFEIIKQRRKK